MISVALWRAGTVARWIPLTLFAATVLDFFAPMKIGWVPGLLQAVATIAIGWYIWASRTQNA